MLSSALEPPLGLSAQSAEHFSRRGKAIGVIQGFPASTGGCENFSAWQQRESGRSRRQEARGDIRDGRREEKKTGEEVGERWGKKKDKKQRTDSASENRNTRCRW